MPLQPCDNLRCPIDQHPMQQTERQWRCPSGHSFDIARQGYVNLLPVQNKKSLDPGDSREMVDARRDFLNGGAYRAIADAIVHWANTAIPPQQALRILDAGCGEGYYLAELCRALDHPRRQIQACALDISKWAVRSAMQRDRGFTGIVASNRAVPLADASQDLLLCLFGFPVFSEFARLLKPGAHLLMIDSGPDHLIELRRALYDEVSSKASSGGDLAEEQIGRKVAEQRLTFRTRPLPADTLAQLLQMTPHYFRATAAARERALALRAPEVSVDVTLRVYQKTVIATP
ncbi:MAG: methyltransferase domain-containing protein [Spongiibacter sp.]|uniref:Methyltransferase domain-containing protein n=1 Tax=Spongiibacter thalassae TaxID=2721624 RepID=A0ABX1GJM7_9GAMM|nr:methyltransferase domain-containing protein [Spongiibacter thalassae]MDX1504631.1 methyltransferase domain-containing protein [Spongiibacter sp.]NKI19439.1 methyltransferase domain-containing protein [Spongiibacter thalassae]